MMEDERRGAPSASGLHRLVECPGSWPLEKQCPETTNEAAESGTRIHAVLAGEQPATVLDDDEQWVAERCSELDERMPEMIGFDGVFDEDIREIRLWSEIGDHAYSGKPDRIRIAHDVALVTDFKTGRGDVPPAERNWQMRTLATLVYQTYSVARVYVAIIAPRIAESVTICRYEHADLETAHFDITNKIHAAMQSDAPRVSGEDQCRYCRAKAICPEAREAAMAITKYGSADGSIAAPTLTGDELAAILPQLDTAEKVIKAIRDQAKSRIAAGGTIPGYELKPGSSRREIPDAQAAFAALADIISPEEFAGACNVGLGKLEALYGSKSGLKGEALKAAFAERLGDALVTKGSAPSLVRVALRLGGAQA